MLSKKNSGYNLVKISLLYTVFMMLCFGIVHAFAADYVTDFDGGIIIPDRSDETLYIMKGGTSAAERNWGTTDNPKNMLWKMPLKNAIGVPTSEMSKYNDCWKGTTSINDVKRVMHNGKIHLVVTGNTGNVVAMYEFATKKCIYWSKTTDGGPHDVEFIPEGSGYIVVGNPKGEEVIEVYDISKGNDKGRISSVEHKGVHSVHWDGVQKCLWAWGSGQKALKNYSFNTSGAKPELKLIDEYPVNSDLFYVGTGHGGSPMLVTENGKQKRYLIFAGKSGIGKFDTEAHKWTLLKQAKVDGDSWTGLYSNPKGVSHNDVTGEVIFTKDSKPEVWSLALKDSETRKMTGAELYKSRWWLHSEFSYPDLAVSNETVKSSPVKIQNYEIFSRLVSGQLKTSIQLKNSSRVSMRLFNSKGQQVYLLSSREYKAGSHDIYMPFGLSSGIYLMKVKINNHDKIIRLNCVGSIN